MSNEDAFGLFLKKCEELTNARVADDLGISDSAVSQLRNGKYGASRDKIMEKVREVYGADIVECPTLGPIRYGVCAEEKRKPFSPVSTDYVRQRKACRNCERGAKR